MTIEKNKEVETWTLYHPNGTRARKYSTSGTERRWDERGVMIYYKSGSRGYSWQKTYSEDDRLILYTNSNGLIKEFKYDDDGREIYRCITNPMADTADAELRDRIHEDRHVDVMVIDG